MGKLQPDKFQRVVAPGPAEPSTWVTPDSQRHVNITADTRKSGLEAGEGSPDSMMLSHYNEMPVGYDASAGNGNNTGPMPKSLAGATDASNSVDGEMLKRGYGAQSMSPTDEMETAGEPSDFYGDAGGYVERNNYLDRN